MIVLRLQSGMRSHFVTRMPEWGLSATLLAFAALLLGHRDTFGVSAAYRFLGRFVSDDAWGFYALVISSTWLVALVINGVIPRTRRWTPLVRSLCGLGAALFWTGNAAVFVAVQPASPGLVNNAGFAFLALASSVIIAREVGAADGIAKRWQRAQTIG